MISIKTDGRLVDFPILTAD